VERGTELVNNAAKAPFISNGGNRKAFNNFSPEVSISYRPDSDLTIYANYKQGFLSGGFNGGSLNAAGDFSYRPQKVKGFEGGIKGRFLDGLLLAELALFSYKITDLQVQVTTQGTIQELRNAGKVSSKGAEFSLTVRPTKGLSVYGNVAYLDGKYDQYYGACYTGQAVLAPGTGIGQCASQPNPTNNNIVGVLQNLSGTQLIRAPKWAANAGFLYETPLTASTKVELSSGISYSDSYITNATSQPRSRQPSYTLFDASIRVAQSDDRWEIALIGKNLTNRFYFVRTSDNPANSVRPTQYADLTAAVSRGREVMLRVGFKY
jgi:iron complex outermembrane receptor protein